MLFGKNKTDLVQSVAALESADYSKQPALGNIYKRISDGRIQFEEAFSNDIQAVMEISSLEISLKHHEKTMTELSNNVADATSIISDAASESSAIAGQVNEQHEELTNTIINASIEAARAGDAGIGFAVVADEIRSLAAVSEEISSSMSEMEAQAERIEEQCMALKDDTHQMRDTIREMEHVTAPIAGIEKTLDKAARIMGGMTKDPFYDLTNQEFIKYIENAIHAHETWLAKLKDMIDSRTILPLQQDSSKCGFGHFYYAITPKNPELVAVWKPMEEKHRKFHSFGTDAVKALFNEDYSRADDIYKEAEKYSEDLISDMKKLLSILK